MASHGHDRSVFKGSKIAKIFGTIWSQNNWIDSYVAILQRVLHSGLFFLLHLQFWAQYKRILSIWSLLLCTKCHTRNGSYLKVYIIDYVSLVGIARNHRLWRERIPAIRSIKSSYFTHFTSTLAMLGMIHRIKHMDFTQYISIIHLGRLGRLEIINSFLLYWLFTLLLIVLNLLLKRSIWGRSVTFSFPNITPFATCYHVGTRGDV